MVGGRRYCALCSNYVGKIVDGRRVSLHRIPKDKSVSKLWIQRMRLIRKDLPKISDEVRVCSEHFRLKRGPQPGDNIPSVFPNKRFNTSCITKPEKKTATKSQDSLVKASNTSLKMPTTTSNQALSVYMHDYCGPVKGESLHLTNVNEMTQTDSVKFVDTQVGADSPFVTCDAFTQTENFSANLSANDILCSDKMTKQYTGIPTAKTFRLLFDYIPTINVTKSKQSSLHAIDEMLLTLMRIRLALPIFDLAFRFSISSASCSKIISRWIQHLYVHLSFMTFWPSRIQINNTMPSDFKTLYPDTRVIIDCTELYTETPLNLSHKSLMYSHYKSHMTYKALVGITPNGVVSFVSDLWAGSISDKQIVIKSGLLDLCEKGDAVMADKGFLISDLTTPKQIKLIIPPRLSKQKQMPMKDVLQTRRIANLRIHVERHMERVKRFKLLHNLKGTMKMTASKIWRIANHLTTLLPPLHPHEQQ